jgi:uncharacterized protein (TIGR02246 family)
MRLVGVVVGALALVVTGASAQQKTSADEGAVAKLRAAYQAAEAKQDAAAVAKLYATDGVEMPPNAKAQKGRAAIEAFHKAFAQQFMMHGMQITGTETHVMGDRAVDIGTYKQTLMGMKTGAMIEDTGKFVVLLKKDGTGAWSITHAIYNSDNPPPPAAPAPAKK